MEINQHIWREWSDALHRWGVREATATLLESFGPLTLLGAQMLYLCQPFLPNDLQSGPWKAFTQMLEDREETKAFVTYLREGNPL
jgi:hypothetical protein